MTRATIVRPVNDDSMYNDDSECASHQMVLE